MSAHRPRSAYRLLLRLFPRGFREENGAGLERLFDETREAWSRERGAPRFAFWMRVVWDTVPAAAAEWLAVLTRPAGVRGGGVGETASSLAGDLRFALRQLVRQPAHGLMVVLLMALGVAGNTAVFRIVDGLFLKPLPFEDAEALVDLDETAPQWDLEFVGISYPDFVAWREGNRSFDDMAVYSQGSANFADETSAERVTELLATHDLDDVLRLEPLVGRFFTVEEDTPDGPRVALLTHGFWERRFAADPAVVGTAVSLDGVSVEIIGVMPATADFVADVDLWLPLRESVDARSGWYLTGIGRLRDAVTVEQARADLLAIHRSMIPERGENEITSPVIHSLRARYLGDYRAGSGFLLGAVVIVLLIACANIAGLMSARALARGPEIGIRIAMGAPRRRIVRQLLAESALLAALGALAGAALGVWSSGRIVGRLADQFPTWVTFDLDGRVLLFTVALTAGAVLLFGLAPALHAAGHPGASLTSGATRSTASRGRRRALSALVVGQVTLAVALLVVGGLAVLDADRVARVDPGFTTEGVTIYSVRLPNARYPDAASRLAFGERYLERLRALPGVESASIASSLPLMGHWGMFYTVEDAPERPEGESNPVVLTRIVAPGYFETMGVRVVAGRGFDEFDGRDGENQTVIVNETFVRTHLGDEPDPIGRRVRSGNSQPWMTVVGVTADVKHYGLDEVMRPGVYQPLSQSPLQGLLVVLRGATGVGSPLPGARALTAELDPQLAIYNERTMAEVIDDSLWARRATAWLIGAFSAVALLLAVAGLYGVITYTVGQRAKEISVRMAMGARTAQVRGEVVRQGMIVVAIGLVAGVVTVLASAPLVGRILVQVAPTEPAVYVGVCVFISGVAALANWLPARRAAATDPMSVLRAE